MKTASFKLYSKHSYTYQICTPGQLNFFYWFDFCVYLDGLHFRFPEKFFQNTFLFSSFNYYRKITHSHLLEIFWTLVPSFILIVIAVPSIFVLYMIDEPVGYVLNVFKVIGHQWYWSYEIADCSLHLLNIPANNQTIFDSFMIPTNDIGLDQLRLLEVDNPLFVPVETPLVFIVTADDVLHSWAIPSLGIKIDAVPGRLNQVYCFVTRIGEFYGQCSELCGVHHGFMPIHVISV